MWSEDAHDDASYLAGSPGRITILRTLRTAPRRPSELAERVDVTRTTVQRVLAGFRDRGWVHKGRSEYHLTVTGERVCAAYENLLKEADTARELAPVAAELSGIDDFPSEALSGAELTVASERKPLAAVDRFLERFQEAAGGEIRSVSPIVSRAFNEAAEDLLADETGIELVIDREVLEASNAAFPDALDRAITGDRVDVFVHPEPLAFGLAVFESDVCLAAYDESKNLRVLLESADPAAYEWAEDRFGTLRERGRPLADVVAEEP